MADDSNELGMLMIRAWRNDDGELRGRVTQAVEEGDPGLVLVTADSEEGIMTAVREWLNRLSSS